MEQLLKQFDLNEKEIKVFLKLLAMGAQPVSVLANNLGMPRTTLYSLIESLDAKDLVEPFMRFGMKYVRCIPVNELHHVLEKKQHEIEQTFKMLNDNLEGLQRIENKKSLTPQLKVHEGKDAVMKMYQNILKEPAFCAYFHPELVKKYMPEFHFKIPEVIKKKKIKAREVLIDCEDAHEYKEIYGSDEHQIRILPKNYFFASDTIICPDRVCVILYDDHQHISAVEIFNDSLRQTQQMTFEALWSTT